MPFRHRFACLWCGQDWQVRSDDDLEGWAALCPECLGKADDNGFLRARLRTALRDRARASSPASRATVSISTTDMPPAASHDDWYLRRGRFSGGPLQDGPWGMELDEVTRWLDAVPVSGTIVELAAGSGWWSTLLAEKGELWVYDSDDQALEAARKRLVAHGLLAHLHQRDPRAAPDKQVDVVVSAYLLGSAADAADLRTRMHVVRDWLKPGGTFVFIEAQPTSTVGATEGPAGPLWPRDSETLRRALIGGDLQPDVITRTRSAFVMGRATRPA